MCLALRHESCGFIQMEIFNPSLCWMSKWNTCNIRNKHYKYHLCAILLKQVCDWTFYISPLHKEQSCAFAINADVNWVACKLTGFSSTLDTKKYILDRKLHWTRISLIKGKETCFKNKSVSICSSVWREEAEYATVVQALQHLTRTPEDLTAVTSSLLLCSCVL